MTTQRYVNGDRLYAEDFNFYLSMLELADTALQPDDIVEVTNEEIDALFV